MDREYTVIVEKDETDYYFAYCPALKGCCSQGKTEAEALANIREAIDLWLEAQAARAKKTLKPNQSLHTVSFA